MDWYKQLVARAFYLHPQVTHLNTQCFSGSLIRATYESMVVFFFFFKQMFINLYPQDCFVAKYTWQTIRFLPPVLLMGDSVIR